MAITTTTGVQPTKLYELIQADMDRDPLRRALQNLNALHKWHRPALVSACLLMAGSLTRTSEYHVPIVPSADGLKYGFEVRFCCSSASQNITVTVDYCTSWTAGTTTWTSIYSQAVTSSGTGGALTAHQKLGQQIPANAVAIRLKLTAPGAGSRTDHHLLVYPDPDDAVAGITACGFVPFDDTMMASGELAAVHTEWLNRCKTSTLAILRDRRQMALSFVQEFRTSPHVTLTDQTSWQSLPPVRCWLPGQGDQSGQAATTLLVKVMAGVDAGATADLIRVRQVGGASVTLAADQQIRTAALAVKPKAWGLTSWVDLEIALKTTSGNTTRPWAVVASWRSGD